MGCAASTNIKAHEATRTKSIAPAEATAVSTSPAKNEKSVQEKPTTTASVPIPELKEERRSAVECAVTLKFLRDFYTRKVEPREKEGYILTTEDVVKDIIVVETMTEKVRYLDMPGMALKEEVGPPDYFISHAWANPFSLLVEQVSKHLDSAVETQVKVWLDIFAIVQHESQHQGDDLGNLQKAITTAQATLVVLDNEGGPLKRMWCLYELDNTLNLKGSDCLKLLSKGLAQDKLASMFAAINVEAAGCFRAEDKERISADIVKHHKSLTSFNSKLKLLLLLDPLTYKSDMADVLRRVEGSGSQFDMRPVWDCLNLNKVSRTSQAASVASQTQRKAKSKSELNEAAPKIFKPSDESTREDLEGSDNSGSEGAEESDQSSREVAEGYQSNSVTVIVGNSGSGKSAIFANLYRELQRIQVCGTEGNTIEGVTLDQGAVVLACHLFKYSDVVRQDLTRVICSLAYQLAMAVPELMTYYCSLPAESLIQASASHDAFFDLLLVKPLTVKLSNDARVVVLLDALDEAQVVSGSKHLFTHSGYKLLSMMKQLPPNVRVLCTTRPEPANLLKALSTLFPEPECLTKLLPEDLRKTEEMVQQVAEQLSIACVCNASTAKQWLTATLSETAGDNAMVFLTVILICIKAPQFKATVDPSADPRLTLSQLPRTLDAAYGLTMRLTLSTGPSQAPFLGSSLQQLLAVLMVAQEPLSLSVLYEMGFAQDLAQLPQDLFLQRDFHVHLLHKSLHDWLLDKKSSGHYAVEEQHQQSGHLLLGKFLTEKGRKSNYALRYAALHLTSTPDTQATELLTQLENDFQFIADVYQNGLGASLIAALSTAKFRSSQSEELLRWLQFVNHMLQVNPTKVLEALLTCPIKTDAFKMAEDRAVARASLANRVCRTLMAMDWNVWPASITTIQFQRLQGGSGFGVALAYSPDGSLLLTGDEGKEVRLWDAATGQMLIKLGTHRGAVVEVAFSPDGGIIASGGDDGAIKLWDSTTGQVIAILEDDQSSWFSSLAFSPDGSLLASSGQEDFVVLWDVKSGKLVLRTEELHTRNIECVAFSPDGRQIASGHGDRTIRIWDAASGKAVKCLVSKVDGFSTVDELSTADCVRSVVFTPDGSKLVSADGEGEIVLWDVESGERILTYGGQSKGGVSSIAISPDGKCMASSGEELRLWDFMSAELLASLDGHMDHVVKVAFSPDGRRIVSSDQLSIKIWDVAAARSLARSGGHTQRLLSVAFSPKSDLIASGGEDNCVKLWNAKTGTLARDLTAPGLVNIILRVAFNHDGTLVACSCRFGKSVIWDVESGKLTATIGPDTFCNFTGLAFSPDGTKLVRGSHEAPIKVWDIAAGTWVGAWDKRKSRDACDLAFKPDGSMLASGHRNNSVIVWDPASGKMVHELIRHSRKVNTVAFSSDGSLLASGGDDGLVLLWDTGSWQSLAALEGFCSGDQSAYGINAVAFSPDGRWLASCSNDNSIKLWDTKTFQVVSTLEGHRDVVVGVAFSPDGSCLASGSHDMTVRVWDTASLSA